MGRCVLAPALSFTLELAASLVITLGGVENEEEVGFLFWEEERFSLPLFYVDYYTGGL